MTELSFLIQLLLNDKLPLEIKKEVAERIKEVEATLIVTHIPPPYRPQVIPPPVSFIRTTTDQAPSTQKILDEMAMNPVPVAPVLASSPVAAQALSARNESIRKGMSGRPEPGRTSPKKF